MPSRADRRRPGGAPSVSESDLRLWQEVTRSATPLATRRQADGRVARGSSGMQTAPPPPPPTDAAVTGAGDRAPTAAPPPPLPKPPHRPATDLRHGEAAGIDRRTHDRFRRGRMAIEGRLDLHGMTRDRAHHALVAFLHRMHDRGARCVIVVTGKGSGREGGGVLRRDVPHWLNGPGLRRLVLSFDYARIRDGGEGALYVLLRRRREQGGGDGR